MHQRPANMKRAIGNEHNDRLIRDFIKTCKEVLEEANDDDAAFRFEMILDHLNDGKAITADKKSVSMILGV